LGTDCNTRAIVLAPVRVSPESRIAEAPGVALLRGDVRRLRRSSGSGAACLAIGCVNGLERKVLVLINEHKSLKEEIKTLKTENQELKQGLKGRDEQLFNFKNQIKISKIVDNLNPEDGSASELKKKVDDYIREIDKCIAYLSR
jgi:hypothetical protein